MKKLIIITPVLLIFGLVMPVFAINKGVGAQTGQQVQNQNQVQTQNQGEESQLQVATQEQESLGDGQGEGLQIRNQNAIENMSEVAEQVQQLLQVRTTGGIGDQVRQIAQEQNQAQDQTQSELTKMNGRSGFVKSLIGPNYQALKNIEKQIEQNQLRIQRLEELQNQLSNQSDITMVQEMIQALVDQNTALGDRITLEEKSGGLFGWLFKVFAQ